MEQRLRTVVGAALPFRPLGFDALATSAWVFDVLAASAGWRFLLAYLRRLDHGGFRCGGLAARAACLIRKKPCCEREVLPWCNAKSIDMGGVISP